MWSNVAFHSKIVFAKHYSEGCGIASLSQLHRAHLLNESFLLVNFCFQMYISAGFLILKIWVYVIYLQWNIKGMHKMENMFCFKSKTNWAFSHYCIFWIVRVAACLFPIFSLSSSMLISVSAPKFLQRSKQ